MRSPIRFSYANALDSAVGPEGLRKEELSQEVAEGALRQFRARVDSGEIGFPRLAEDRLTARSISAFADGVRGGIDDVVVVGIGGSALGAYALDVALRGPHPLQTAMPGSKNGGARSPRPRLVVLDNIDPGVVAAAMERLNPKRTLVCVIAKSGSTAETMATFLIIRDWMRSALGKRARAQIVAVTDPKKGDLLEIAREEQYPTFFVPPNVGGRFSIFSSVGLLPAALIGLDLKKLLRGVADATELSWQRQLSGNPAMQSALIHHALERRRGKSIEVVFAYSSYLWGAAFWYRQLWAESLGKRVNRAGEAIEAGQTPVAALGATDQHSQLQLYAEGPRDKMVTFWEVEKPRRDLKIPKDFASHESTAYLGGKNLGSLLRAERIATEAALTRAARPNCRWTLP